ncbi:hypothetical protein QF012_004753 [Pseudomonas laurylsulfatiphila]
MAATQKDRSGKTAARRRTRGEEEIRLHCMAGTRQALAELMAWSGIEEQGEAITLMIYHLHALGPQKSAPLLAPPPNQDNNRPRSERQGKKQGETPWPKKQSQASSKCRTASGRLTKNT